MKLLKPFLGAQKITRFIGNLKYNILAPSNFFLLTNRSQRSVGNTNLWKMFLGLFSMVLHLSGFWLFVFSGSQSEKWELQNPIHIKIIRKIDQWPCNWCLDLRKMCFSKSWRSLRDVHRDNMQSSDLDILCKLILKYPAKNKITDVREIIGRLHLDYFVIRETELNSSFPSTQFHIGGY